MSGTVLATKQVLEFPGYLFKDDDDDFKCNSRFEKAVHGMDRMDAIWRLICSDG